MSEVPEEIRRLAERREQARRARDFSTADSLRDRIRDAGFDVTDTPRGPELKSRAPPASVGAAPPTPPLVRRSDEVASLLDRPVAFDASVQWLEEGWAPDVVRGIDSFRRHQGDRSVQHVVVDAAGMTNATWPRDADVVHVVPEAGWATARNAGLRRSAGAVVLVVDGSIEATGDVLDPLVEALHDPTVGLAGPFGVVTGDLREFQDSKGPDVDAVEGYLMAFRRELLLAGRLFDEKFKFYRMADVELSFQVKAMGLRAIVTPVPVARHEHRMWSNTPEEERDRLSKRNFYHFLDRWRGRTDLLVRHSPGTSGAEVSSQ
ncbi:MAG: hypothetical protein ACRDGU_01780 [Actinomycetota bacterium]